MLQTSRTVMWMQQSCICTLVVLQEMILLQYCFSFSGIPTLEFTCKQGVAQWHNRWGGQGAECPPRDFWPGNFCWRIGKKRQGKKEKGGNWEEKKEKCRKGRWKIGVEVGKATKRGKDLFFPFFFLFTFENNRNLFWVYQNLNFLPGKSISRREKIMKNYFAPSEKNVCYAPGVASGEGKKAVSQYKKKSYKFQDEQDKNRREMGQGRKIGGILETSLYRQLWLAMFLLMNSYIINPMFHFHNCLRFLRMFNNAICWNWISIPTPSTMQWKIAKVKHSVQTNKI